MATTPGALHTWSHLGDFDSAVAWESLEMGDYVTVEEKAAALVADDPDDLAYLTALLAWPLTRASATLDSRSNPARKAASA